MEKLFNCFALVVLALGSGFVVCQFVSFDEAIPGVVALSQLKSVWFFLGAAGAVLVAVGAAKIYEYVTTKARNRKIFDALESKIRIP